MNFKLNFIKSYHNWIYDGKYENGFFSNIVPYNDYYVGTCRVGVGGLGDRVNVVTYDKNLNLISSEYITNGEDPRTFIYEGKPYAVTWDPYNYNINKPDPNQIHYKLLNLIDKKVINLNVNNIPPGNINVLGKNWMPLIKDNKIYIVISIEPVLNIIKVNTETGFCEWTENSNFNDQIFVTENRGGTPFIFNEKLDCYIGVGHKTYTAHRHTPYIYTLTKDLLNIKIYDEILTGHNLVEDPHSIFIENGNMFCCINNWDIGGSNNGCGNLYQIVIEE